MAHARMIQFHVKGKPQAEKLAVFAADIHS
jgi:hypothetical protein